MSNKIASVRGMHDILPDESAHWQYMESVFQSVLASYCYREIRFPILEVSQLFMRSVGEVTDIVEKEMYTFLDRNNESVTLRPEGTAGCVRAAEQHGLLYNQIQRLFYYGPMFRYERPQKGRLRQFHQVGVEAFGMASVEIDLELILLSVRVFKMLGIEKHVTLEINTIGDSAARAGFGEALLGYLQAHKNDLDEDSLTRMHSNPMRILDSKVQTTQLILKNAPELNDFLSEASKQRFENLKQGLNALGITFVHKPSLVRGLDYYNDTVFEWTTDKLGAQATVCAGGRYDTLVEKLGGRATPAAGFAMGLERLLLLLETLECLPKRQVSTDVFVIYLDDTCAHSALLLAEEIRTQSGLSVLVNCDGGSIKSQMKKADKSSASFAVIIGEHELAQNIFQLKFLREQKEQQSLSKAALLEQLITTH